MVLFVSDCIGGQNTITAQSQKKAHMKVPYLNSLTPKSVPEGAKNSRLEGFLLGKHKHTNIPTMMEPFAPPAAWFFWSSITHPREPLQKGLAEAVVEGF
jgi:hypothetical protein